MSWLFHVFFLCFVGITVQEAIEIQNLHDAASEDLRPLPHDTGGLALSVRVKDGELREVSSSVLRAERWLRTHVLSHYPANKITTIVVGSDVLCDDHENKLQWVLPAVRNIHHSLTRWGLQKDIAVSASFSSSCMHWGSSSFGDALARKTVKSLLEFLHGINSTYSVSPSRMSSPLKDQDATVVFAHSEFMKKLGFFGLKKINIIVKKAEEEPMSRMLSSVDSKIANPLPTWPAPLPDIPQPPLHSSVGFSVPAHAPKNPDPPLAQNPFPPPSSPPTAPELPPLFVPAGAPMSFTLPPCNPVDNGAPAPEIHAVQKLWCVAKPSVPAEALQEAMDYACGEGGADCDEIMPNGSCYHPDTVVAHASYAFNSYWQKNKRNGGTCNFGGTAMLINSDPSFLRCRFVLT